MIKASIKDWLNRGLRRFNLKLDSLTLERMELVRLRELDAVGHFDKPAFPLTPAMANADLNAVLDRVALHEARFRSFTEAALNEVKFQLNNGYFMSPDAEVLYTLVRGWSPRRFVEVGSGNSTKVVRQAILDGKLATRLISIDPAPRADVTGICDELIRGKMESPQAREQLGLLREGDVLFIDSSHQIRPGNDVVYLLLEALPRLPAGVFVHIHDIFLPYEYPKDWIIKERWDWTEQYLVQAMLGAGDLFAVIWPGHYFQRSRPDAKRYFPWHRHWLASSLWLKKLR